MQGAHWHQGDQEGGWDAMDMNINIYQEMEYMEWLEVNREIQHY
jgi:hypothetical protein